MNFQPVDRLPRWEWAMWWDKTIDRWHAEGLPAELTGVFDIARILRPRSLPAVLVLHDRPDDRGGAAPRRGHRLEHGRLPAHPAATLPDHSTGDREMRPGPSGNGQGEAVVWITLEGFFWFPRTLMGFEKLMLGFYDQPELIHRINQDLLEFNLRLLDQVGRGLRADVHDDRRGHVVQPRADDLAAHLRRVHRALLPPDRARGCRRWRADHRRYRRRRDPAGALAAGRGSGRRAAAGTAGGRRRHGAARAVPDACGWSATSTRWS